MGKNPAQPHVNPTLGLRRIHLALTPPPDLGVAHQAAVAEEARGPNKG